MVLCMKFSLVESDGRSWALFFVFLNSSFIKKVPTRKMKNKLWNCVIVKYFIVVYSVYEPFVNGKISLNRQ